ncbi:MAG: ISAs1 family transposase [Gemmataceae bacterium]|nr:ISAs1 family transposase [Gemmataceae bacterium]
MRKPLPAVGTAPPGSLAAALAAVPDPRRPYGWDPAREPLPLVGLLQFAVAAILCGARSLYAMAQWGRERVEDDPGLLTELGLPAGRSPSVATLHRVFKALDVEAFERAVGSWLAATGVQTGEPIALDGKALRGVHGAGLPGVHLIGAHAHGAGAILAQVRGAGKGQELAAVKRLLAEPGQARELVGGRLVTGDALLTQRSISAQIVAGGGDYVLPVDENQPALREGIAVAFPPLERGAS